MKFLKMLLPLLALNMVFGQNPTDNEVSNKDIKFLRDWFKSKRAVSIREKGGDLSLSADVRSQYKKLSNKILGVQQYDSSETDTANDQFFNEVNIYFDYRTPSTWAHIKLKFDNQMGSLGGTTDDLALDRALFGYRIFEDGNTTFDIELGRDKIYNWFDSKVQYNTLFDGAVLTFTTVIERVFDLQLRVGGTVVDFVTDHYGYILQAAFHEIATTGLFFKYSYTHWDKDGSTRVFGPGGNVIAGAFMSHNPQVQFGISQFLLGYEIDPEVFHVPLKFYGAYLYNHRAPRRTLFGGSREAAGWYAGMSVGRITKQGDWAFETVYQSVEAQAVPGWDMAGIGIGNPFDVSIFAQILTGYPAPFSTESVRGNTNFRGWTFQLILAITNNITLVGTYDFSKELHSNFGTGALERSGSQKYHLLEIEAIYAF